MKVYMVSRQWYEEFYVFGMFTSKKRLNQALDDAAKDEYVLSMINRSRKESEDWYHKTHLRCFGDCKDGCEHKPEILGLDDKEACRYIFEISEFEANEFFPQGEYT